MNHGGLGLLRKTFKYGSTLLVAVASLSLLTSCKHAQTSKPTFSTYDHDYIRQVSLLSQIHDSGGTLKVTITFFNKGELVVSPTQAEIDAEVNKLERAFNAWIQPLQGLDGWRTKSVKIEPKVITDIKGAPCDYLVWDSDYYCKLIDGPQIFYLIKEVGVYLRAHVGPRPENMMMVMAPEDDYNTYLHEVGHTLGMGDTYEEYGYQKLNEEHPKSVMRGEKIEELTQDDRDGIQFVWRYLATGLKSCPAGYRQGSSDAETNSYGKFFCIPEQTPKRPSCSAASFRSMLDRDWGVEPDGSSCYVGNSPQRDYPTCSAKVKVDAEGWGDENGQRCNRWVVMRLCSGYTTNWKHAPDIGYMFGSDFNLECMVRACNERASLHGDWGDLDGEICRNPNGAPVISADAIKRLDGYPYCTKLATVTPGDTWGMERNGVKCHVVNTEKTP